MGRERTFPQSYLRAASESRLLSFLTFFLIVVSALNGLMHLAVLAVKAFTILWAHWS